MWELIRDVMLMSRLGPPLGPVGVRDVSFFGLAARTEQRQAPLA